MKRFSKPSIAFWWALSYPIAVFLAVRTFFECLAIRDAADQAWGELTGDFQLITENAKRLWRGEPAAE